MIADQSHISKLILILCDVFLLNFDFFPLVSEINEILLPKVFINLYEIFNSKEPFLLIWDSFSNTKNNLEDQFLSTLELLDQFDPDNDWLELHYQLLIFKQDFSYFIPFLEKIQTATSNYENSKSLLKLFQFILSNYMEDSNSDEQQYFINIIEIVVSLSNSIIENENLGDDFFYDFVIYLWDSIFGIEFFFYECDQFDLLDEIISEYIKSLHLLIHHSENFRDSLNTFSEFLCSNNESPNLEISVVSFLDFLSELIDSNDEFFRDQQTVKCINCIQKGFEDIVEKYVISIIEQTQGKNEQFNESFFVVLGSTESGFLINFIDFSASALIQMMSNSELALSAETVLFFIRKAVSANSEFKEEGEKIDLETIENLIKITFELFECDSNEAIRTIESFCQTVPTVILRYSSQIISVGSSDQLKINESCSLVLSLFSLLPLIAEEEEEGGGRFEETFTFVTSFIDHYLNEIGSLFETSTEISMSNSNDHSNELNSLNDCLYFIFNLLLNKSADKVSDEFKSSLFGLFSSSLSHVFLIDDETAQKYLCNIFGLFFNLNYITNKEQKEFVVEWIENIFMNRHQLLHHLGLIKYIIDDSEIQKTVLPLVFSIFEDDEEDGDGERSDFNEKEVEVEIIDSLIHQTFLRQCVTFWDVFPNDFLMLLLSRNKNIVALNKSLDLFLDIFNGNFYVDSTVSVTEDFAVLTLQTLFESTINFYQKLQFNYVLKIVHEIIKYRFLPNETVISIFFDYFDNQIPGVIKLASLFESQKVIGNEEEEEIDNGFDLEKESNLISLSVNFIRKRVDSEQ